MILKASMDGRDVKTVTSLNSSIDYAFTFTLDYSQQLLFWIYYNIESSTCFYRIESSSVSGGSEQRTIHSTFLDCHYSYKPAIAIDFFKGAVYYSSNMEDVYRYYSRYSDHTVFKITVEHTPKTTFFPYIRQYVCHVLNMYSGIKIISPERQLQGIAIYLHKILESLLIPLHVWLCMHVLYACIMQELTHVPSITVAVLISVYSALTIQETINVPVTVEHSCFKINVTVPVGLLLYRELGYDVLIILYMHIASSLTTPGPVTQGITYSIHVHDIIIYYYYDFVHIAGSCLAAGYSSCCLTGHCRGEPPNCNCDSLCHIFDDCCSDAKGLCQNTTSAEPGIP